VGPATQYAASVSDGAVAASRSESSGGFVAGLSFAGNLTWVGVGAVATVAGVAVAATNAALQESDRRYSRRQHEDDPSTYPTAGLRWGTATQVPREPGQPRSGVEGVGLFGDEALEFDEGGQKRQPALPRHPEDGTRHVGYLG